MKRLVALLALMAAPAFAQDHSGHGAAAADLPAICLANAPAGGTMAMGHDMMGADAAHADLMAGMAKMNADMAAGGTASDIDVAFICSMIPHHQGAIDMARAELAHGDDPFARDLAEKIIAAQEQEIADMRAWLERQPAGQ